MEDFPPIDFHDFHLQVLPAKLTAGNGLLAAEASRELPGLCFRLKDSDNAYSFIPGAETIDIIAGTEAETVVVLDQEAWQGLVYDLESAPGLLYANRVECSGDPMTFVRWEPALRAMFQGRPLYDANAPLINAQGERLQPDQSFTLQDSPDSIKAFLDAAGYLLIKDVFSAEELQHYRCEAKSLGANAREGDKISWWGKNKAGESVLCRVIHAGKTPLFHDLYQHPQIKAIASLLPDGLTAMDPDEVDSVTVIYKNPGMVEGLSDLPWHRDCGLGGHAVMCPKIVCSIYLYDAKESMGPLKFLPGSHRCTYGFVEATDSSAPEGVLVQAKAGDVTLHFSDVMHAAPPPAAEDGQCRVSVLLNFDREYRHHTGARHYNDVLLANEDGQVEHLEKKLE